MAVSYLCTRVKEPTKSDYEKLKRTIRYMRSTIHLPLVLGWDESGIITWSAVDAAFAVHNDMRSHTGACTSLGKGSVMSWSMKQKITTKSSTEAELVGVDDASKFIVWTKRFFEKQFDDYPDDESKPRLLGHTNIVEQDNTSAIQLERCGKRSSTKRTRHINIRYFYCTELLKDKMITAITYKPTNWWVCT